MTPENKASRDVLTHFSSQGLTMWRNNRGVTPVIYGPDGRIMHRPVRYGIANETPDMGRELRSGDFLGWYRTQCRCGLIWPVFSSVEVKPEGWQPGGGEHDQGQAAWARLVTAHGGFACIATSSQDVSYYLQQWRLRSGVS